MVHVMRSVSGHISSEILIVDLNFPLIILNGLCTHTFKSDPRFHCNHINSKPRSLRNNFSSLIQSISFISSLRPPIHLLNYLLWEVLPCHCPFFFLPSSLSPLVVHQGSHSLLFQPNLILVVISSLRSSDELHHTSNTLNCLHFWYQVLLMVYANVSSWAWRECTKEQVKMIRYSVLHLSHQRSNRSPVVKQ
jgi:hypothetical protein